jgi:hypothetical protein
MSNANLIVARAIAARLLEAEEAVDTAFQKTAELAAFMPVARQQSQTSAGLGQSAFERVTATMQVLSGARRALVETHAALADMQEKVGLRPRNFGGFVDKPDKNEQATLQIVPSMAS